MGDIEFVFRRRLSEILYLDLSTSSSKSLVTDLLNYGVTFSLTFFVDVAGLVKIPYTIFDDILQSQTIEGFETNIH